MSATGTIYGSAEFSADPFFRLGLRLRAIANRSKENTFQSSNFWKNLGPLSTFLAKLAARAPYLFVAFSFGLILVLSFSYVGSLTPGQTAFFGYLDIAALFFSAYLWFGRALATRRATIPSFGARLDMFEAGCAILTAIVVAYFEPWKGATWTTPKPQLATAMFLISGLVSAFICLKGIATLGKAEEGKKNEAEKKKWAAAVTEAEEKASVGQRELQAQIEKLTSALEATRLRAEGSEKNYDNLRETVAHIHRILKEKAATLSDKLISRKEAFDVADFFSATDPKGQIQLWISAVHAQYHEHGDHTLRVALYHKDPEKPTHLAPFFAHNGIRAITFANNNGSFLEIRRNSIAVVVRAYLNPSTGFRVIEDCEAESQEGKFQFFSDDQKQTLKSMVAFPHEFKDDNGETKVLVLALLSGLPHKFRKQDEGNIKIFLSEVMRRVEYEFCNWNAMKKLLPKKKEPPKE